MYTVKRGSSIQKTVISTFLSEQVRVGKSHDTFQKRGGYVSTKDKSAHHISTPISEMAQVIFSIQKNHHPNFQMMERKIFYYC